MEDAEFYGLDTQILADKALFAALYEKLPSQRQAKVDSFKPEKSKYLSLGAGILLAYALKGRGLTAPALGYGGQGKPYLKDYPDIHFNLAHSGFVALCAIAPFPVGCDVEELKNPPIDVAKRFFHADEVALLTNCPNEAKRQELFFRLWTLKESQRKLTGQGLSCPLNESPIEFSAAGEPLPQFFAGEMCYFAEYARKNHLMALAAGEKAFPAEICWVTGEELCSNL